MRRMRVFALIMGIGLLSFSCTVLGGTDSSADPPSDVATVTPASVVSINSGQLGSTGFTGNLPATKDDAIELLGSGLLTQFFEAIGDYIEYADAYENVNAGSRPAGVGTWVFSENTEGTSGTFSGSMTNAAFSTSTPDVVDVDTYGYRGETGGISVSNLTASLSYSESGESNIDATASLISSSVISNMRYDVNGSEYYDEELMIYVYEPGYSDYTINAGMLNANLNGSLELLSGDMAGTLAYNIAVSLSGGAVISPHPTAETTLGGKLLFTLVFADKRTVAYSEDIEGNISTEEEVPSVSLVLKVYDNANSLRATYTYTVDDILETGSSAQPVLSFREKASSWMKR